MSYYACGVHGWRHENQECPTCRDMANAGCIQPGSTIQVKPYDKRLFGGVVDPEPNGKTAPKPTSTINFDHKRRTLIEYMKVKMDEADWHGVSDVANDLREIEAEHRGRNWNE